VRRNQSQTQIRAGPIARLTTTLDASYSFPWLPAVSIDTSIFHFSWYPASVDNVVRAPPGTTVALGARYRFKLLEASTTLRLQVQNLTNAYFWNLGSNSPEFSQYHPRAFFGYLTADF
jgi:iron complex outermembrane receptor protein